MNTRTKSEGPMVLPRAFALLRLLAEETRGLNLSDISGRLDVPKSSLSSTLKALTEQMFLEREGALYTLGPEAYTLSAKILAGRSIRQVAQPYLKKTMEACEETVLLAVLDSDMRHATYIDCIESPKAVRFAVTVGTRRPLYANACGRLFLAHQSKEFRNEYFKEVKLVPVTEKTITEPDDMEALLTKIRTDGISITLGDYSHDAGGFAAPIFNSDGDLVAALTIEVPISRALRETERFKDAAIASANAISRLLGHTEEG
ncbi:IclR family transcriptional regulator [Sneathiella aquimaris]|uniref:IclR family transcriptional regulator n=1 Tax=Sneathiella aquimaris TaxID=2599305 RepID=UPI00146C3302|nr:IclR family transcriptional regulator [Sneathiella aquimaris]